MVPESRSYVQFPPATHFLPLRVIIPTYLAVSLSTHMSERTVVTRTQQEECWTIA
jgi:hypothetical protein